MHGPEPLIGIVVVVLAALAIGIAMQRVRQPAVVGYILAGIVLGPSGLRLIPNSASIPTLAELGVIMLLYLVGMELSLRGFREVWKVAVGAAALQIFAGVSLMLLFTWATGLPAEMAIILGFVIALSSTAVVVKMLEQVNALRQPVGQLTIGVLIAQDLAVVPMMLTIALIDEGTVDPWGIAKIVIAIGLLVGMILYLSRRKRLVLPFDRLVGKSHDLQPLAALVICFGGAALTGAIGLSPVLGAFLAGLVVGNSTARARMVRSTLPIQSVLLMVFFLSIGLLIDLNYIWNNLLTVLAMLFIVTVVKTVLNIGILHLLREPWPHAFVAGVMLAQIGEFSLVIGQTAVKAAILTAEENQLIVAVVAGSLMVSPLWLATARRVLRILLLSVTSFRGTLEAARSPNMVAAARLAAWSWRQSARGALRASLQVRRSFHRLTTRRRNPAPPSRQITDQSNGDEAAEAASQPTPPAEPQPSPETETKPAARRKSVAKKPRKRKAAGKGAEKGEES